MTIQSGFDADRTRFAADLSSYFEFGVPEAMARPIHGPRPSDSTVGLAPKSLPAISVERLVIEL